MCKTIGEFIAIILQTEITRAKEWLDRFVKIYDDPRCKGPRQRWEEYCKQALTIEAVQNVAYIFSAQVSFEMRDKSGEIAERLLSNGHRLLQEIYQKAVILGIGVRIEDIDYIVDPRDGSIKRSRKSA